MTKQPPSSSSQPVLSRPLKPGALPPIGLTPKAEGNPTSPPDKAGLASDKVSESGGPQGSEPTRFGDWERKGRCSDF
ncbi:MAG: DUF1674 domain-containing protein [Alphaproteobacteria bacterium]|nr:DUF1674 domain-containing protein [Alphaproteobacteria bacterium]